ncbi:MAG: hypothetical protein PF569_08470 [Candidatus Woesearchaeota archaeon]|jgi:hypothetical protein|nr:hypothetical protein [Candidatus Woesearchaeota archaeon]
MTLLHSNNLNKGFSVEANKNIAVPDNYVNVTQQLKERIAKETGKEVEGLFVRKSGSFI